MNNSAKNHYSELKAHKDAVKTHSLHRLFEEDPQRAERFSLELNGLYVDYSKNHITTNTIERLCAFAEASGLPQAIHDLLSGKEVNNTENRKALHSALRHQGTPTTEEHIAVAKALDKMRVCVNKIHSQQWLGYTGKPIRTVINIGIGGSDLGPRMVTQALSDYQIWREVLFTANVDGADLSDTLVNANPETTLFITSSKSFNTSETLENTLAAKEWMLDSGCAKENLNQHFIAITSNIKAAQEIGISEENIFPLWDWVGGRFSLWSCIGLPIAIAIGMDNFEQLLAGAHEMDQHYSTAPTAQNLPVIAALIGFWYSQFWETRSYAILPYAQRLSRLPAYLQQLDMESLGKSISRHGEALDYPTGNIIWGSEGTNGQHSFYQLLHQGTHIVPADFILIKEPMSPLAEHHKHLLASGISQSQALLQGKTLSDAMNELRSQGLDEASAKQLAPHKMITGNKPSTTIIIDTLHPKNLGALLAFYEHKVHASSVLLDINPFDQWGVELGKQLAKPIYTALSDNNINPKWDNSTKTLIDKLLPN